MHSKTKLLGFAERIMEKTAAKADSKRGGANLFRYTCPETGKDFYLTEKKTSVKSPYTGKNFSAKPEKDTLSEVGKELKDDALAEKNKKLEEKNKSKKAALEEFLKGKTASVRLSPKSKALLREHGPESDPDSWGIGELIEDRLKSLSVGNYDVLEWVVKSVEIGGKGSKGEPLPLVSGDLKVRVSDGDRYIRFDGVVTVPFSTEFEPQTYPELYASVMQDMGG